MTVINSAYLPLCARAPALNYSSRRLRTRYVVATEQTSPHENVLRETRKDPIEFAATGILVDAVVRQVAPASRFALRDSYKWAVHTVVYCAHTVPCAVVLPESFPLLFVVVSINVSYGFVERSLLIVASSRRPWNPRIFITERRNTWKR